MKADQEKIEELQIQAQRDRSIILILSCAFVSAMVTIIFRALL